MEHLAIGTYLVYGAIMFGGALVIGLWKGRVLAAIVWSTFLGPLGWLIVAMGPSMHPAKAVDCPHCAGVLPINQAVCNHCGNKVLWVQGKARKPSRAVA
jgi:hypothetical protein